MAAKKDKKENAKAEKEEAKERKRARGKGSFHSFRRHAWLLLVPSCALPIILGFLWPRSLRVVEIERVPLHEMSVVRFIKEYSKQKPVVITGAWSEAGWLPEELAKGCPLALIRTFKHDADSSEWGKLVQVGVDPLKDYVAQHFARNIDERPEEKLYGFEFSLKFHCPKQLEGLTIPPFLTEDAFHMVGNHTGLGWPSVLVGPKGTETGMHIDTHRLPFWIAVVGEPNVGLKKFRIFPHEDQNLMKYGRSTEKANYVFDFDPWSPNMRKYPAVADSFAYERDLVSGDLLYIPGGSPHAVKNLADNTGISMNYLDLKSFPDFVKKATPKSPLYRVLKGAGTWLIDALENRRALGRSLNYFEFAGLRDRDHFCEVHRETKDNGTRPAGLAAYCDT